MKDNNDVFEELRNDKNSGDISGEVESIISSDCDKPEKEEVFFGKPNTETDKKIKSAPEHRKPYRNTQRTLAIVLAALVLLCAFFGGMYVEKFVGDPSQRFATWAVNMLNSRAYFVTEPLTVADLAINGIKGCVPDDPYISVYLPKDIEALKNSYTGSNTSIGMTVGSYNLYEGIYILSVIAGSPADKAGVKVDYRIVSVDGIDYWDKTVDALTPYILSVPDYTDVTVVFAIPTYYPDGTMTHDKNSTVTITVQRQEYTAIVATYYDCDSEEFSGVLDEDTAYIEFTSFMGDVKAQFDACMKTFKEKGKKNLILDLRQNTGGSDYNLSAVGSHLLKDEEGNRKVKILTQRFKDGSEDTLYTDDCYYDEYNFDKIIVLTSNNTASASEALLLAMKDYGTVDCIIGTTTYGKGTGLETVYMPFADYAITYTVSYFYSPKGNTNEKIGIQPTAGYYLDYSGLTNLPYSYSKDNQILRAINYLK